MDKVLKVGTRKSMLAVEQTNIAVGFMKEVAPETEFELVYKLTQGDKILDKPLLSFGGKGVFVTEFEEGLQKGEIDFAVHSAKDLPMELAEGLEICGIPKREDPRDVLITLPGTDLNTCREIVIGTSSLRRKVQIELIGEKLWPGIPVRCENLRGNVQTRLGKLEDGGYDAIILAAAGLKRLGMTDTPDYHFHYFDCEAFIPAGGQGILAIEGRIGDPVCEIARKASDPSASVCLKLEREVLRLLNAGCHEPVGVYAHIEDSIMNLSALYQKDGEIRTISMQMPVSDMEELAEKAVEKLLS